MVFLLWFDRNYKSTFVFQKGRPIKSVFIKISFTVVLSLFEKSQFFNLTSDLFSKLQIQLSGHRDVSGSSGGGGLVVPSVKKQNYHVQKFSMNLHFL